MSATIREFARQSHINELLIRAVIRQCGGWESFQEMAQDVTNHGAAGGFHGFIYYTDTCSFYTRNRGHILAALRTLADDLGENVIDLVGGFNCLKDGCTSEEVGETLYGPPSKHDTQVANALAWFALEEVSRSFTEMD